MESSSEIGQSLISQFKEVFNGEPWYGDALVTKLDLIRKGTNKPQDLNKTASYVQHLINWRQFTIKKLAGDIEFDITLNTVADWSDITIDDFSEWHQLIETLTSTQQQLLRLIGKLSSEELQQQVPGKDYNFEYMLHGLIQHEVYHTGQIAVYWKNR